MFISLRIHLSLLGLYQVYQFKNKLEFVWFVSVYQFKDKLEFVRFISGLSV